MTPPAGARPRGGGEAWGVRLEAVEGHLLDRLFHVEAGGQGVGGDVVAEHECPARSYRLAHAAALSFSRSRGSVMWPVTADAATVYAEPRYTSELMAPMRPLKLRAVEARHTSFSASTPAP